MKKLLSLVLFPLFLNAQSSMLSDIPLPKTYVQNLDPYSCDSRCLEEYLHRGMIFSFLAHIDKKLTDQELSDAQSFYTSILNLGAFNSGGKIKVAILLPYKKIGKYAASTTSALFAYLMTKTNPFVLKSYRIENEEQATIAGALEAIKADGFNYVIAPLTQKGGNSIVELDPQLHIFFPTLNHNDFNSSSEYLDFGAIDYKAQSTLLLQEAVSPLVIFSDKSKTGQKLARYQAAAFKENAALKSQNAKVIAYFVSSRVTNLENYIKKNKKIQDASFFLNTPVVKSGMILSQLTLYDTNTTNVLSTQINYDPLILTMTQYDDRKKMIIANSIIKENNLLTETNALLGNDIIYDWINYTTSVGIDYFYSRITGESRDFDIPLQNHQMVYDIELLKPSYTRFVTYYSRKEELE